jgi:hypothetical protein
MPLMSIGADLQIGGMVFVGHWPEKRVVIT